MNYKEFLTLLTDKVRLLVNAGDTVTMRRILKNNGVWLDGLSIMSSTRNGAPTIYVNEYFKQYKCGRSIESIAKEVMQINEAYKDDIPPNAASFFEFDNIKKLIAYRVINYKQNEQLLSEIPHKKMLDLAVVFCCIIKSDESGLATVLIRNSHLDMWGVDEQQVFEHALCNTPTLLPARIIPMQSMIEELLSNEASVNKGLAEIIQDIKNTNMYVLTNIYKLQGAACILYDGILKSFSDKIGADVLIIPSSVHEVILLPWDDEANIGELTRLIEYVNNTSVDIEEILACQVYRYKRDLNMVVMADDI